MSKIERLLNLTAALLDSGRPLTAAELRTKIEGYPKNDDNFFRMFERDKDDLRSMGVPIEVETSFGGQAASDGYIISADDYYLPDLELTADELSSVNLALLSIQLDGEDVNETLWKVGGVTSAPSEGLSLPNIQISPDLSTLFTAISKKQVVEFEYQGNNRTVSPWRLELKRGRWYLIGSDHDRQAERNYRLDRMSGAVSVTSEVAVASTGAKSDKKPWQYGDDIELIDLQVVAERADYVERQLGASAKRADSDAGALFTVEVASMEPFRAFVIDLLDHAEIVSPVQVREDFVSWIKSSEVAYA